jgi:hypothetical protein
VRSGALGGIPELTLDLLARQAAPLILLDFPVVVPLLDNSLTPLLWSSTSWMTYKPTQTTSMNKNASSNYPCGLKVHSFFTALKKLHQLPWQLAFQPW